MEEKFRAEHCASQRHWAEQSVALRDRAEKEAARRAEEVEAAKMEIIDIKARLREETWTKERAERAASEAQAAKGLAERDASEAHAAKERAERAASEAKAEAAKALQSLQEELRQVREAAKLNEEALRRVREEKLQEAALRQQAQDTDMQEAEEPETEAVPLRVVPSSMPARVMAPSGSVRPGLTEALHGRDQSFLTQAGQFRERTAPLLATLASCPKSPEARQFRERTAPLPAAPASSPILPDPGQASYGSTVPSGFNLVPRPSQVTVGAAQCQTGQHQLHQPLLQRWRMS